MPACPSEAAFRNMVASRLRGTDPFTPDAKGRVEITLHRLAPEYFTADIQWHDGLYGLAEHKHEKAPDCTGLLETVALFVALDLTPVSQPPRKTTPAPAPAPPPPPPATQPSPPPIAAPVQPAPVPSPLRFSPPSRAGFYLGVAGAASWGRGDGTLGGLAPWVEVRLPDPDISVELGMRALGSVATRKELGPPHGYLPVRWTYLSGVVAVNAHRGPFFIGLMLDAGRLAPSAPDATSSIESVSKPLVLGAGFRAGVQESFARQIFLRSMVEGEYLPVAHPQQLWSGPTLQAAPTFAFTVAVGLGVHVRWPGERSP
jgi:hypothetical protein